MSFWRGKGFNDNIYDSDYEINDYPLFVNACGEDYVEKMSSDYIIDRPLGRNDYQMLYIKEGYGEFLVDGKVVKVEKNHIVIYHPHHPQWYRYPGNGKTIVYWIHFSGSAVAELLKKYNLIKPLLILSSEFSLFESTVNRLLLELRNEFAADICSSILQTMLVKLSNFIKENSGEMGQASSKLERIRNMMEQNISSDLNIADYSREYDVSEAHFIRIFKDRFGVTPLHFIINKRIEMAMHLLESTELSIKDIALSTGFDNSYYFSRMFKKLATVTPTDYRKQFVNK